MVKHISFKAITIVLYYMPGANLTKSIAGCLHEEGRLSTIQKSAPIGTKAHD
jgi:hypothetical protein